MIHFNIMTVAELRTFLGELDTETLNAYQVWLSSDEEGNAILPIPANPELSITLDLNNKRLILFPAYQPKYLES